MNAAQVIEADYTWREGRFQSGVKLFIDQRGDFAGQRDLAGGTAGGPGGSPGHGSPGAPGSPSLWPRPVERLRNRALLPGFVSAHSHAFQRGLRGRGETFPPGAGSFWAWRQEMYTLVRELNSASFDNMCRRTFHELLATGVTTVGEFHYLHHLDAAQRDFEFDRRILKVAAEVGIRIVLLGSFYRSGGFGQPLSAEQLRFSTPSAGEFLTHMDELAAGVDGRLQRVGLAPHSVRAVGADDLSELNAAARQRGWPLHMHLEEQPREVEDCLRAHGKRPLDWVMDTIEVGPHFTAIHATHTPPTVLERFLGRGARVCLCPLTEANLGDGLPAADVMNRFAGAVCVGTDSNSRLDFVEELRWLEYGARLRGQKRGVCVDEEGSCARRLLQHGTVNGAAALRVAAGELAPGRHADFFTIDLAHPALAECTPENLLDAFLFGAGAEVIRDVCVGGRWVRGSADAEL